MKTVLAVVLLILASPAAALWGGDPVDEGFKKAEAMLAKAQFAKARAALDEALAGLKVQDPRLVRYHERTGASWLREDKIPEARASFAAAVKAVQRLEVRDEASAKAYAGMGLCLRREKKDAYALRFFKKTLELPADPATKLLAEGHIREIEAVVSATP